jgi:hypothetical protein
MKKGGTTEFRKVAFYPSRKAVETAAAKVLLVAESIRAPRAPRIAARAPCPLPAAPS